VISKILIPRNSVIHKLREYKSQSRIVEIKKHQKCHKALIATFFCWINGLAGSIRIGVTYTREIFVSGYESSSTKEIFRNYLSDNSFLIIKDFTGVLEECRFTNNHCLIIDGYTFPVLPLP
jgi:dynactin complex subunit